MSLVMSQAGEVRLLELLVNQTSPADLTLHLFSNDRTPSNGDSLDSYDEVFGGGYVAKKLKGDSWFITGNSRKQPTMAEYPPQEFLFSGVPDVITVFGYFVVQGDTVLWAERFPESIDPPFKPPFIVTGLGDKVIVTPVFTLQPALSSETV